MENEIKARQLEHKHRLVIKTNGSASYFLCPECGFTLETSVALKTLAALIFIIGNVNEGTTYQDVKILLGEMLFGTQWALDYVGKGKSNV